MKKNKYQDPEHKAQPAHQDIDLGWLYNQNKQHIKPLQHEVNRKNRPCLLKILHAYQQSATAPIALMKIQSW